ncbi:MAG: glycosyltransferase, partial [Bacteroidota bacterium]
SDISKQNLVQQHNREKEKIFVVKPAADEKYKPLLWTEKENTKIEFTGGKEYFSVTGINETKKIITVLKAFSIFKKKQQSNMHLVIIAENITGNSELFEKLENFKYRTDVHLHNSYPGEETVNIISSAYALVCSGNENALPVMVLNAFNAGIPVVVSKQDSPAELTSDAVLYTDITDQELLAADLNKLYKDEMLRSRLIEKGKNMSQKFNRQQSIEQVWNGILHATNNPQQNNYS